MRESPEQRSRFMRAVKSTGTQPEKHVRSMVHCMGFRFRLHRADLPGKPDLVLPKLHKIIFVHGCFWHGHHCKRGRRIPATNREYWVAKIGRNAARDKLNARLLKTLGWQTLVIWECELRNPPRVAKRVHEFLTRPD